VLLIERVPIRVIAGAAAAFLVPIGIDLALQRHFGVINNGVMSMYCAYTDPSHAWSPACGAEYIKAKPTHPQVLQGFLQYLTSGTGLRAFLDALSGRVARDFTALMLTPTLALLACAGWLGSRGEKGASVPFPSPLARALAVVAALAAYRLLVPPRAGAPPCFASRPWVWPPRCGSGDGDVSRGYLVATSFLALLNLLGDRLQHTISVCLYLSVGLFILESRRTSDPVPGRLAFVTLRAGADRPRRRPGVPVPGQTTSFQAACVTPTKAHVRGNERAAIKITEDRRIDRSLYYSGHPGLIYTRADSFEVGHVRKYARLAKPKSGNETFLEPNAFLD
jgi:hypothetical protein